MLKELVVFGYAAHGASTATRRDIARFCKKVGEAAGTRMSLLEAGSYEELGKACASGQIDLAWLPPIPFIALERRSLVSAIVTHHRGAGARFHSALVVRADSPAQSGRDLVGGRAAWVDPYSAAGFVLPRVGLAALGVDPRVAFTDERFYRSHDAVVRAVLAGRADFGATYTDVDRFGATRRGPWLDIEGATERIRIVARFGAIPGDVLAVRSALSDELRAKILRALLFVAKDKENRPILRAAFGSEDLVKWDPSGYGELRNLTEQASSDGLLDLDDYGDVSEGTPMYGVRAVTTASDEGS